MHGNPIEMRDLRNEAGVSQIKTSIDTKVSRCRISRFECGYIALTDSEIGVLKDYYEQLCLLKYQREGGAN